jgi:adhesin transport system outer membrane protein
MQADMASDYEIASRAMSELATMADSPLDEVTGLSDLRAELLAEPLEVMKARAEAARTVAELTAARAGFLPGLTARGSVGSAGSDAGLTLGAANGLGFGLGADLGAIDAQRDAAQSRIAQVQEDSNRRLAALEGDLASLQRQAQQAETLAAQAAANYDIFAQQQRAGQRAVPEVVSVFETKVRTAREAASLRYEAARIALRIAALRGVLVDGDTV